MFKQFGHEVPDDVADPESILPLHERPSWKATHRNEYDFWKETEADQITEDEARAELRRIQTVMQYSDADMAILYNWLNIARYEGRAESCIPMLNEEIKRRYRTNAKDSSVTISKRIRRDIVETLGRDSSRVVKTFSKNLGGNYWKGYCNK